MAALVQRNAIVKVFSRKPATQHPAGGGQSRSLAPGLHGFTLVELLVAVAIVVILLLLTGAAYTNARASQAKQATQSLIAKIDDVIAMQFASYVERRVPDATSSEDRSLRLRRLASAEMPDSWADVRAIEAGTSEVSRTPAQDVYVSILGAVEPTDEYGDAECLFMVVMQSGLADCLDCVALGAGDIGDVDGDGAPEFLDAWGQPIRYVLWPAGLELLPDVQLFFSTTPPFFMEAPAPSPGGVMRPLIFSCGPDEFSSIRTNTTGNLALGDDCGLPAAVDPATYQPSSQDLNLPGGRDEDPEDGRPDNITNFDSEVKR
jgi:prepilin-type N-terminal cleavage/methylation domain-containing protein